MGGDLEGYLYGGGFGVTGSIRNSYPRPHRTVSFEVFKVNLTNSQLEKVECLDDRVLFFDLIQSVSLSTRDFPALERNSIYFTVDRWSMMRRVGKGEGNTAYGGHDIGVYSVEDGVVKPFDEINNERILDPPPFWILPWPVESYTQYQ
ncbi:hypothetical protein ACLB2K_036788 [Fragaria x ananassa]